jgi:hypothetical protein
MTKLRKIFTASVMFVTILSMSVVVVPQAGAAASAGDLIRTANVSAVYYLGADNKRYVFPTSQTYFTWYSDFSGVMVIPQAELESYAPGGNLTARPGTKLIQEVSMETPWTVVGSKVYAVGLNGAISQIPDAATAVTLYGANWESRIMGVPSAYFTNYTNSGATASATVYPSGSLVKMASSPDVYFIDGDGKARKIADEAAFSANRFNGDFIITAASTYVLPTLGTPITAAETALTDASAGSTGTGIQPGAGTGLTVALSSDTPASTSVPASTVANQSATNVPYLKVNFTASNDGDVTISNLTFHRTGVGSAADFAYVYLYDGDSRLTTGKSVNSSSNDAVFNNVNVKVAAGTTKTLTLKADIASGLASVAGADAFQLVSASSVSANGATVSGSFPITGNTMSLTGVSIGKLTVTAGADPSNPSVGAQGANMASVRLVAATEDIKLNSLALYQGGTISNSNLSNFKLYDGATLLASTASINSANLVTFTLAAPLLITKGQTKTLDVKGDLSGAAKNGDTIVLYVENATDVYGIGQTYGFGAGVDFSGYDNSVANTEASNCTVSGGQLTFSSNGPSAANVRGNNVNLMNFSIASGVNAEIKSLNLELYYGGVKGGATSTNGYITNFRIVDVDTNTVVGGPLDLGNTSSWTDVTLGSSHAFTDTITIAAGKSRNFKVLADLNNSLSKGPIYVVLGSTAGSYVLSTTAGAKNIDNNQWIADIVPSTKITGNTMTFTTSALTVSAANSPATHTASKGDQNVESLGIVLSPATSQTAKVTQVKVAGYIGGALADNMTLYQLGSGDKVTDTVSSISLWDGATQVGLTRSFDTAGYAIFDNLNVTVPSTGKILTVKANLSSSATTTGSYAIGVTTPSTSVVAYDESNNSITPTDASGTDTTINGTPTVYIKLASGGTLQAYLNSAYPTAIVAGNTAVEALSSKFYATNQAMKVQKMIVAKTDTRDSDASYLSITYAKDAIGTMETKTTSFVGDIAQFTDLAIYVPKDGYSRDITYKIMTGEVGSGATSGDSVYLSLSTSEFEAVPADGGSTTATTFTGTVSGASDHVMYIRKGVPTITTLASSYTGSQKIGGIDKFAEFSVTAAGGQVALKKIKFNLNVSDGQYGSGYTDLTATDFKLFRNGTEVSTSEYRIYKDAVATSTAANELDYTNGTGTVSTTTTAFYVVFDQGGATGGEETISAGSSVTYAIGATVSAFESARDTITTSIATSADTSASRNLNLVEAANYYVSLTGPINENLIWSDMNTGADHASIIDASSADWHSGYKVKVN